MVLPVVRVDFTTKMSNGMRAKFRNDIAVAKRMQGSSRTASHRLRRFLQSATHDELVALGGVYGLDPAEYCPVCYEVYLFCRDPGHPLPVGAT